MDKLTPQKVWIENEKGDRLEVQLTNEGGVWGELLGKIYVNEVPYHVFFATPDEIGSGGKKYVVDLEPGYEPCPIPNGAYPLIAPYSSF